MRFWFFIISSRAQIVAADVEIEIDKRKCVSENLGTFENIKIETKGQNRKKHKFKVKFKPFLGVKSVKTKFEEH